MKRSFTASGARITVTTDRTLKQQFIYHFCRKSDWLLALETGRYRGSDLDKRDGFIHFSTAGQARETAALHLAGVGGLILLKVDATTLGDALRWEASRGGAKFPHLYGSLESELVIRAEDLPLDSDGNHIFPDLD